MRKKQQKPLAIDGKKLLEGLQGQFRNLDPKDPSLWPAIPKLLLCLVIVVGVVAGAWFGYLNTFEEELQAEQGKEVQLRKEYSTKVVKAVGLEALKAQREQVEQYVSQLEKQLPSKAEMAALLSDVNHAGMGRSLQFDLFKPGNESVREYYAELPIEVRVSGRFHDMGSFVSDVAHLSRIVTLNNISIAASGKDQGLVLNTQARTYRYLDSNELSGQRQDAKKGGKKK